jgi:type III pantothenate kinase
LLKTLILDIGNSRIKIANFQNSKLIQEFTCNELQEAMRIINGLEFEHVLISSVKYDLAVLQKQFDFPFVFLNADTHVPFKNEYLTPQTLGVDRKAAVVGARERFPDGHLLVVDLGSCITFDVLNDQDQYLGGNISPGISMRFKAMNEFTARLPLTQLEINDLPQNLIGKSTQEGMQIGVYQGVRFEMEGYIKACQEQFGQIKVIICGGDSILFESLTKDYIFVIPNLVLFGLNRILCYNVDKK